MSLPDRATEATHSTLPAMLALAEGASRWIRSGNESGAVGVLIAFEPVVLRALSHRKTGIVSGPLSSGAVSRRPFNSRT